MSNNLLTIYLMPSCDHTDCPGSEECLWSDEAGVVSCYECGAPAERYEYDGPAVKEDRDLRGLDNE